MAATPEKPPLTDSPWFWVLMFSGVAMLGIVAVGPKYVRRQARTEQRYANRLQTWQHQQEYSGRTPTADEALETGRRMESQPPRASLVPLAVAAAVIMAVSAGGLLVSRRRQGGG